MGGLVFSAGENPLVTPRMPPKVYNFMKQYCHDALKPLYHEIDFPIEGPGKETFGDVDVLVACPKQDPTPSDLGTAMSSIASALGALKFIQNKGEGRGSAHVAVPWPSSMLADIPTTAMTTGAPQDFYVQVDVRICDSVEKLRWISFRHAHGDMWNLIGSTIRPFGLTADEVALHIRIPEVEQFNKKGAKIFLTSDPNKVLEFLGLPKEPYYMAFDSLDDMYEYAAQCRLFWVKPASKDESESDGPPPDNQDLQGVKSKLKANDRRRMSQRPGFSRWIEEFIPKCRKQGRFLDKPTTREAVRDEALDRFHAREQYYRARASFVSEKQLDQVRRAIKDAIPADPPGVVDQVALNKYRNYRGVVVKAFKDLIIKDDSELWDRWKIPRATLKHDDGLWDIDAIRKFIEDNKENVGNQAMAENLDRFQEHREKESTAAPDTLNES